MDATEAADALVAWVEEVCTDVNKAYDHDPATIADSLPVALASVGNEEDTLSDPRLGLAIADQGLEQAALHIQRSNIELLVPPNPPTEATEALQGFVAALAKEMRRELREEGQITLGGRVEAASPFWAASYEPPFLEFDDGTTARRAVFSLAIAELV